MKLKTLSMKAQLSPPHPLKKVLPPSKSPRGKLKTNSCARRSIYSIGTSRNRKKIGYSSLTPMN
jgi:hypothetical protein